MLVVLALAGPAWSASLLSDPIQCRGCWRPAVGETWQWQLTGRVDTTIPVGMYEIDLFDNTARVVAALHRRGVKVVCYISAGTWESWRPDAARFPLAVRGRAGWPGERWLDIRRVTVLAPLMRARLNMCKAKGFDGVEFDNVDGYSNPTGFPITSDDQLRYDVWLAGEAHKRGLSVGLKNDLDQAPRLLVYFDWILAEQCVQYRECEKLRPFVEHGKAAFDAEYRGDPARFCAETNALGVRALKKRVALDAWRIACR